MIAAAASSAPLHGIVAEFASPEALLAAARRVTDAGYTRTEAYTPFSVEGLADILHQRETPVALITLIAGMSGGLTGFFMCYYAFALYYPINVGGRPPNSWP